MAMNEEQIVAVFKRAKLKDKRYWGLYLRSKRDEHLMGELFVDADGEEDGEWAGDCLALIFTPSVASWVLKECDGEYWDKEVEDFEVLAVYPDDTPDYLKAKLEANNAYLKAYLRAGWFIEEKELDKEMRAAEKAKNPALKICRG